MTDAGGYTGEESADGSEVLYTKYGVRRAVGAARRRRPGAARHRRADPDLATSWAVTDAGVLFPHRTAGALRVLRVDPATGATDTLRLALGQFMPAEPGLTASADGRRVVFAQVDRVESDLMLVEPFE